MNSQTPTFTLGVEEEYLLVNTETRALVIEPPQTLIGECEELIGSQVSSELLRSQIEVGTKVCKTVQEARSELIRLRIDLMNQMCYFLPHLLALSCSSPFCRRFLKVLPNTNDM